MRAGCKAAVDICRCNDYIGHRKMEFIKSFKISLLLTVILLSGSVRAVYKYVPHPEIAAPAMLIVGFLLYWFLMHLSKGYFYAESSPCFRKILILFLLALPVIASCLVYPIADARRNIGAGSTADDAMLMAARSFLEGHSMYAYYLPGGIRLSPGPGWVLLNLPFLNSVCFWMMGPFYLMLFAFVIRMSFRDDQGVVVVLIFLSSSPLFWELLVSGHDILPLALAISMAALIIFRIASAQIFRYSHCIPAAVFLGLISTSRIIFAGLPILLALFLWKMNRKAAVYIGAIGLFITLILHTIFYYQNADYQPFHLIGLGMRSISLPLIMLGTAAEIMIIGYALVQKHKDMSGWLFDIWLCLAVPLAFIAYGGLKAVHFNFSLWEWANYLFPAGPLFLIYMVSTNSKSSPSITNPGTEKSL
jgi:hypothetical protein